MASTFHCGLFLFILFQFVIDWLLQKPKLISLCEMQALTNYMYLQVC